MTKILSAQVDESIIHQIGILADEFNMTNEAIIENAIKIYSKQKRIEQIQDKDIFTKTFGAWQRSESPEETIKKARSAFNKSMERHH
ncbi:MAG: hypothetical protein K8S13_11690 [Desulfobacula sp.]|uniref:hypothetical protein n=1 Tax=Desulfobacula sp. TaxID=2593537 RepID=UPI0025B861E0|nr:hypothetical protein [Desulfobacula sp.]MCD4720503.1 hypothetical protein [Desulfobacula sp.]